MDLDRALSVIQHGLCERCNSVDFHHIFQEYESEKVPEEGRFILSLGRPPRKIESVECPMCRFFFGFSTNYKRNYKQHVRLFDRIKGRGEGPGPTDVLLPYPFLGVLRENSRLVFDHRIDDEIAQTGVIVYLSVGTESLSPVRSIEPATVDYEKLRSWLESCQDSHVSCSEVEFRQSTLEYINLIDCLEGTIIRATTDRRYLALSYVWGKSTRQPWQNTISLDEAPLTVQDAVRVVRMLGRRYLWVDKYCINQNDASEKGAMIRNMDQIFEHAEATIVALYGENDEAGLPGVSAVPRKSQARMPTRNGYLLSSCPPVTTPIARSKWATRGWTYQEARLSRRCLFFTKHQVYGVCAEDTWSETVRLDPETTISNLLNNTSIDDSFSIFENEVNLPGLFGERFMFSKRTLTHDYDVLDAFRGILSRSPFVTLWGIPILPRHDRLDPCFGLALGLLWMRRPESSLPRHISSPRSAYQRRPGHFPTWSWTSVIGEISQEGFGKPDFIFRYSVNANGVWRSDTVEYEDHAKPRFWLLFDGNPVTLWELIDGHHSNVLPEDSPYLQVEGDLIEVEWDKSARVYRVIGFDLPEDIFEPQLDLDHQEPQPMKRQPALKLLEWTVPKSGRRKEKRILMTMLLKWVGENRAERIGLLPIYEDPIFRNPPSVRRKFILQ